MKGVQFYFEAMYIIYFVLLRALREKNLKTYVEEDKGDFLPDWNTMKAIERVNDVLFKCQIFSVAKMANIIFNNVIGHRNFSVKCTS